MEGLKNYTLSRGIWSWLASVIIICLFFAGFVQALAVTSINPARNALNVSINADINVTFDANINRVTVDDKNFFVYGTMTGDFNGVFSYDYTNFRVTFNPDKNFQYNELITVILTRNITQMSNGVNLDKNVFSFRAKSLTTSATFDLNYIFTAGSGAPYDVVAADFNGDGKMDFALTNYSDKNISVLMGDGNGTFRPETKFLVGVNPYGIVAADFNNDGKLDLAVTNNNDKNISILMGDGNGTFRAQAKILVGTNPRYIAAADFNADGKLDLAVANLGSDTISVLLGDGNGEFEPQLIIAVGDQPEPIAADDFDGDGNIDIAVGNFNDDNVSIMLGDGNGTFRGQVKFSVRDGPEGFGVTDFNNDGKTDIAVSNHWDKNVTIHLGNGDGTFQLSQTHRESTRPTQVEVADYDGDGDMDYIVINRFDYSATLALGDNNGTFGGQTKYQVGIVNPWGIAAADFNGDGKIDFVVGGGTGTIIFMNVDGSPTVSFRAPTTDANLSGNSTTISFDVNDSVGVSSAQVYLNGVASSNFVFATACTAFSTNYYCSYTETGFTAPDGSQDYNITIDANDTINNSATDVNRAVHVDLNAPTITIITGVNDTNTASRQIVFDVNDSFGGGGTVIQDINFLINSGSGPVADANFSLGRCLGFDSNRAIRCDFFASLTISASVTIRIDANDYAGNTADDNVSMFTYDVNRPTVSISSPAAGTYFGITSASLQYTADDFSGTGVRKFYVRNSNGALTSNGTSTSITYSDLNFGTHTFQVIANDFLDNNSLDANLTLTLNPASGGGGGSSGGNGSSTVVIDVGTGTGTVGNGETASQPNPATPAYGETTDTGIAEGMGFGENEVVGEIINVPVMTTEEDIEEVVEAIENAINITLMNEATDELQITRQIMYIEDGNGNVVRTRIVLIIKNISGREIADARAIEYIPKSLLKEIDKVITKYKYKIIRRDPIIEFVLGTLARNKEIELVYDIPYKIPKEHLGDWKTPIVYSVEAAKPPTKVPPKEGQWKGIEEKAIVQPPTNGLGFILTILLIAAGMLFASRFIIGQAKRK